MAHAAAHQHGSHGHDVKFFVQLEWAVTKESTYYDQQPRGRRGSHPQGHRAARFPLLKRKMDRVEARRQKAVERLTQVKKLPTITITDEDIIGEVEEAATQPPWKRALLAVGLENGLVDEGGRPVNPWARGLVARGRKAHNRARRAWYRDRHFTQELKARFSPLIPG